MEDLGSWGKTKWCFEEKSTPFEIGLGGDIYVLAFYCITCFSVCMDWSFVLFMSNVTIQRFSDGINNLKEILFWVEEFDHFPWVATWVVHLRFALPKIPAKVVVKFAIVSSPSTSWPLTRLRWLTHVFGTWWHCNLIGDKRKWDFICTRRENSPAQGELHSSASPRRPSSRCCWRCSPPSRRCSRQNLSS